MMDLLDMGFAPAPAPVSTTSLGASGAASMFGGLEISGARPTAPSAAPTATSPITDLFGDMSLAPVGGGLASELGGGLGGGFLAPAGTGAVPLKLSTAEFGQRWGQTPVELKQTHSCRMQTLAHLRAAMPASYHHVESIPTTWEAIFAATTGIGSVILIHVKLFGQRMACDITVKASSREICSQEMVFISSSLSSYKP